MIGRKRKQNKDINDNQYRWWNPNDEPVGPFEKSDWIVLIIALLIGIPLMIGIGIYSLISYLKER